VSEDPRPSVLRRVLGAAPWAPRTAQGSPAAGGSTFYLQLEIGDEGWDEQPRGPAERNSVVKILTRGRQYSVRMSARPFGRREEVSVQVESGAWFELMYTEPTGVGIEDARRQFSGDLSRKALSVPFVVEIPREGPAEHGEFQLFWLPDGDGVRRVRVASLSVMIDGLGGGPKLLLEAAFVSSERPPAGTAILHVTREGDGQVRLWGGASSPADQWSFLKSIVIDAPPAALGDLVTWHVDPATVAQLMRAYSRAGTLPLQMWLSDLLEQFGDKEMNLVISDHTDLSTPWEMLTLARADRSVVWLGAAAVVSRWAPVHFYQHRRNLDFSHEPREGGALVYVEQELPGSHDEVAAATALSLERCTSLDELRGRLKGRLSDLALIYLASHGTFSTDSMMEVLAGGVAVGSDAIPENRVTVLQLEGLGWHDDPRPLVFVNACHSARIFRMSHLSLGLPGVLLSQVAGAYIGTLGPVGSRYAAEVAGRFLRTSAEAEGTIPARFLRELRSEAVAALEREETPENDTRLVFAFSYVMYGNPLIKLRLRQASPGGSQ
jgi:hypothetical protein